MKNIELNEQQFMLAELAKHRPEILHGIDDNFYVGRWSSVPAAVADIAPKRTERIRALRHAVHYLGQSAQQLSRTLGASAAPIRGMSIKYDAVIWDEWHLNELPFVDSVADVYDAEGFNPAVRLCDRHPELMTADDWRRATTFDLYSIAVKVHCPYYRTWTLCDILDIKRWITHLDTVQVIKFDDVTAPADVYHDAMNGYKLSRFEGGIGLDYLRIALLRYMYPKP